MIVGWGRKFFRQGSLFLDFMTCGAFGRAFTLFFDRPGLFGLSGDLALMTIDAVQVVCLLAPQFKAVRGFWRFWLPFFPEMTLCTKRDSFGFASIELFKCEAFVCVMTVGAV